MEPWLVSLCGVIIWNDLIKTAGMYKLLQTVFAIVIVWFLISLLFGFLFQSS